MHHLDDPVLTSPENTNKMEAHTARAKHSLVFDKMLVEAQSQGLNTWDNLEELMEFIELQRCLKDVELERITEARRLAILVRDASKVLVDLGMPPFPGIPQDLGTVDDILEAVGTTLERLQEVSQPVLRSNRMLIVCVLRSQVYTHIIQKMDIE
jgi:hypothetical protein